MRYTENERYYTAESTITWPLDPLIQQPPPLFFIAAFSWNETFNQPDYPGLPQTTPDYQRLPNFTVLPSSTLFEDSHIASY